MDEKNIYFAGLFDGEGCISINKIVGEKQGYKRPGFQLRLSITNTNKEVLEEVQKKFGGKLYTRNRKNSRTYYDWVVVSKQCIEVLESLKPYLIIKKRQAEIALEFQKARKTNKTDEEWLKDFSNYEMIRKLNARFGSEYYTSS